MKEISDYQWFRNLKANSITLEYNEHACEYITASEFIDRDPMMFSNTPADQIQLMRNLNSIWSLQIYPDTPIGSYTWYGSTCDNVLSQAREFFNLMEWRKRIHANG